MKIQNKSIVTTLIIGVTFVLAGVGIFTATRLYQLRDQAVAPNAPQSKLFAWDCSTYTFNVTSGGDVSIENASDRTEPAQKVDILVDNAKVATLDVPGFGPRSPKTPLGHIDVPLSGKFSWKAVGSLDCQNNGDYQTSSACSLIKTTPDSGNWNSTNTFTTKNTGTQPVTIHWYLDCESRVENKGKPAMSSCKNTEGDTTLAPNETIQKGFGAVCLTWQYDITCQGQQTGYVVEPQSCSTPTSSPTSTPTATPTSSPTASPTSTPTSTSLPNLCSLNFSLSVSTSTPSASPTSSPTSTPTATPTSSPTASPTSTPTTTPTSTATSTPVTSSTPTGTPTIGGVKSSITPTGTPVTLPNAGVGTPTIALIFGGALLTILAIVVAL